MRSRPSQPIQPEEGLVQLGRRVGQPAPFALVASYFTSAAACWLAATAALVRAAPDLARGANDSGHVLLAVHLVGLGFLPFAVAGGALHVLPVLLRNGAPNTRPRIALPLLWAGPVLAYGIAAGRSLIVYPAAAITAVGVVLLVTEVVRFVAGAPHGRIVLASKIGVLLSAAHALAAFTLGALVFGLVWQPFTGESDVTPIAIHLNLAVLGWLTLLILTVGRTLGPMLALAPAEGRRRAPVDELLLAGGLWLVVLGLAAGPAVAGAGAALVLAALARFGLLLNRVRRGQRLRGFEGPIAHFLAGIAFLAQAALSGLWLLAAGDSSHRLHELYVLFFLGGWAAGVTVGHLGKLLSLSAWTWWPRGPRPSQAEIYPRRLWLLEALLFAIGIETVAAGILRRSEAVAYGGSALIAVSALVATIAVARTLRVTMPALRTSGGS